MHACSRYISMLFTQCLNLVCQDHLMTHNLRVTVIIRKNWSMETQKMFHLGMHITSGRNTLVARNMTGPMRQRFLLGSPSGYTLSASQHLKQPSLHIVAEPRASRMSNCARLSSQQLLEVFAYYIQVHKSLNRRCVFSILKAYI